MKQILLIAILALFQAAPPVPRKTVNNGATKKTSQQNKSASPQAPSGNVESVNKPTTTNPNQQNTPSQTGKSENSPMVVVVQGRSDVSVHKDTFDYGYIIGSLLLTLITLVIAGIAWKQANAAKASVNTLVNIERPWLITPDFVTPNTMPRTHVYPVHGIESFTVKIKNYGKTPALLSEWSGKSIVVDDINSVMDRLDYSDSHIVGGTPIPQGETRDFFIDWNVGNPSIIDEIAGGTKHLYIYGCFKYRDSVGKIQRDTYFCFHYFRQRDNTGDLESGWAMEPLEANKCT